MASILRIFAVVVIVLTMNVVVFAQGEAESCLGDIEGEADTGVNGGKITFDAHAPFIAGKDTDLGILGLGRGYAPGNRGNAACSERSEGRLGGKDFDHRLKGFAWSDNVGFISFSCESGRNLSGAIGGGAACGSFDYGVYFGLPAAEATDGPLVLRKGERQVFGYGYNPVLGYLQFDNVTFPEYGVKVGVDGRMTGYAWTQAGIWLDMSGVMVELFPDSEDPVVPEEEDEEDWCLGKPLLCVEVDPFVPGNRVIESGEDDGGEFNIGVNEEVRVADGLDGYDVDLYLRGLNGGVLDPAVYDVAGFTNSIVLVWEDSVKRGQLGSGSDDSGYNLFKSPFNQSSGGVVFKPLGFADFKASKLEPGHFVSSQKVASYAPTTSANVSFSSSEPPFPFSNELFLNEVRDVRGAISPNRLVLKRIEHGPLLDRNGVEMVPGGVIFPNGRLDGTEFHFRPALNVDTLYVNNNEDEISAYRGVPVNFRLSGEILGNLPKPSLSSAGVTFGLDYSREKTELEQGCSTDNFEFKFLGDLNGQPLDGEIKSGFNFVQNFLAPLDIQAVATLPELEDGEESEEQELLPCTWAESPSFYTYISYMVGNKVVSYYSNKLPKTTAGISNPSIVVHGNIYGQKIGTVAENNQVQLQGSLDTNVVRDRVNANLEKYGVAGLDEPAKQGRCTVSALRTIEAKGYTISGNNCVRNSYRAFTIGEENVLYVKGQDTILDLKTGSVENDWVILVDGGNLYLNGDVNNEESEGRLTLVTFRDPEDSEYFKTGNAYLAGGKALIVDATMVFDGSLFSYSGDLAQEFGEKGEPVWESEGVRRQALSYQALIRGSIYSDNTIGGADLDGGRNPKDYLLLGGGEVLGTPVSGEDRLRAQAYDLNYLRMFTLEIERCANGYPKDQVCGRCLAPEDIVAISQGERLCGEKPGCDPVRGNYVCNGINSSLAYEGGRQDSGDLVPPRDRSKMVSLEGVLDPESDFDPVYVFFRAPNRNSFIFK